MKKDLFAKRASVRKFKPDEIDDSIIEKLLFAAAEAPSAGNKQPWHFYVVKDEEIKAKLSEYSLNQTFIQTAPIVIVICAEPSLSSEKYAERGIELYCIQDTAAAIENILLCAVENDLGACWCGAFDENLVREAVGAPETRRPIAVIPVGYPDSSVIDKPKPKRRPMEDIATFL